MHAPLVSINIVSFNTKDITLDALRSIERSVRVAWLTSHPTDDIEIVVVDNASTDGSVAELESYAKTCPFAMRVIALGENIGFGRGHNRAAAESRGEILLLLNTDTICTRDALNALTKRFLEYNPSTLEQYRDLISDKSNGIRVHFLGPKLLNADMTAQPSCGPYYSIPTIIGALFLRGDHWSLTRQSPTTHTQVDWVSGAAFMCKRADFTELGGFDEKIFMYMEEIDLHYRARKKGMNVWFTPDAQIVHLGSASSNKRYPIFQVYRGFLYLYSKHHSRQSLYVVQSILWVKAALVIALARLLRKPSLLETYTEAQAIVREFSSTRQT